MEALFSKHNYFRTKDTLRDREAALAKKLRESLQRSGISDDLFEYLVVRRELGKEALGKEFDNNVQGKIKELSVLIELFNNTKPESE